MRTTYIHGANSWIVRIHRKPTSHRLPSVEKESLESGTECQIIESESLEGRIKKKETAIRAHLNIHAPLDENQLMISKTRDEKVQETLVAEIEALKRQLKEKQAMLDRKDEQLKKSEDLIKFNDKLMEKRFKQLEASKKDKIERICQIETLKLHIASKDLELQKMGEKYQKEIETTENTIKYLLNTMDKSERLFKEAMEEKNQLQKKIAELEYQIGLQKAMRFNLADRQMQIDFEVMKVQLKEKDKLIDELATHNEILKQELKDKEKSCVEMATMYEKHSQVFASLSEFYSVKAKQFHPKLSDELHEESPAKKIKFDDNL